MPRLFQIEDELHAEVADGEFGSFEAALTEVRRLASIPWGEEPNVAPCQAWRTCGRRYEIVEYETSSVPYWTEERRVPIVEILNGGVKWFTE